MVLNNYAHVLRELNRLPEAADYSERAYSKVTTVGDELVISQSLLERSRIYMAQHNVAQGESMLAQVEPRLRKTLPPGHYAFAAVSSERALIAMERRDFPTALQHIDESIAISVQRSRKPQKPFATLIGPKRTTVWTHEPGDVTINSARMALQFRRDSTDCSEALVANRLRLILHLEFPLILAVSNLRLGSADTGGPSEGPPKT